MFLPVMIITGDPESSEASNLYIPFLIFMDFVIFIPFITGFSCALTNIEKNKTTGMKEAILRMNLFYR